MMGSALVRKVGRATGFAALTLTAGASVAVGLRASSEERRLDVRDRVTGDWSRGLLRLFGIEVVTGGAPPGPLGASGERGRIVVSNHRSIIDIAILLSLFGGALVSRGDLEKWPIIGPSARAAGTIFVDRKDRASGARAIQAMVERLAANDTICLFPEGTTFVDDEVRPFKPGAFVAASRAKVPVVPIGLTYPQGSNSGFGEETFLEHLGRLAETRRTVAHVEIGSPMEIGESETVDAFRERCRSEVARLVATARARHQTGHGK